MIRTRVFSLSVVALAALGLFAPPSAAAQDRVMVVYLPSTPTESASRVIASVTQLAAYLSEQTGIRIEAKAFRRAEDATAYLSGSPAEVALVLTEQSFLLDLPAGLDVIPAYRFVRGGRETRRRVVIVRTDDRATSLSSLRGRTLAVALAPGSGSNAYLARAIFGGELVPERWFSRIVSEPDDFTAITNVLFGRVDAALVGEDNPLLAAHLGKDLRQIYTSRAVSLPVVAIRSSLADAQRTALEQALASVPRAADSQAILAGLSIDRLQRIPDGNGAQERAGVLKLPSGPVRTLEIAVPSMTVDPPRAMPLAPDQLPFFLGIELLDLPIPLPPAGGRANAGNRPNRP